MIKMAIEIFGLLIAFANKKRESNTLNCKLILQLQINPLSPFLEETRGTNFYALHFSKVQDTIHRSVSGNFS